MCPYLAYLLACFLFLDIVSSALAIELKRTHVQVSDAPRRDESDFYHSVLNYFSYFSCMAGVVLSPRDLSDRTYLTLPSEDNEQFIEGSKATSTTSPTISILKVEEAGDAYLSDANSESFDVAEKGNA